MMQLEKSKALPSLSAFVNYGKQAYSDSFTFFERKPAMVWLIIIGSEFKCTYF